MKTAPSKADDAPRDAGKNLGPIRPMLLEHVVNALPKGLLTACLLLLTGCATTEAMRQPSTPAEWRAEMQPPLEDAETAALAETLDLAHALELGAMRNPAVAAARERWLAQIHVEPQAVTPPDPTIELSRELRRAMPGGTAAWTIEAEQMLPIPHKLSARGRVASLGAAIAELQYEAAMRDLIIDVKDACYELYYLDQALPILERTEDMLRNQALLAYSQLQVGRTPISEAFRAESEAAQLAYDRILLLEQRAAEAERLRTLLNLPPETEIGPVRQAPVYAISTDLEVLQQRAEDYAEVLRIQGLETQRAAYETHLARLERVPDLMLGGNWMRMGRPPTPRQPLVPPTLDMDGNGMGAAPMPAEAPMRQRNPVMGMLTLNLPIYEWRNRALIEERRALERAMRFEALDELNAVRAGVAQAYFSVRLSERLLALYDETLLPQAAAVRDQAEAFYRADQAAFASVLETTLAHQNFTLARLRAQADHGQAIGQLERLLGTTAEPRPEVEETEDED